MNVKGTKKKNQVIKENIFVQQELIAKAEEILQKNNIGTLCDADLLESLN